VAGGDPLTDLPLAIAGIGELVCVLERAGELLAGDGVLAQGGVAAFLEAVAELGQRGGAMLELPHERQAGVGELGALERRRRRREPVERELDDRAAVGDRGDLGVDREVAELADRDALPVGELLHAHGEELRGGVRAVTARPLTVMRKRSPRVSMRCSVAARTVLICSARAVARSSAPAMVPLRVCWARCQARSRR
jgi:hypothetical protein